MRYDRIPGLAYPPRLNCAGELLDRMVERGNGERPVFHHAGGVWSYADLLARADARIASDCEQAMRTTASGQARTAGQCVSFGAGGDGAIDRLMRDKPATFQNRDTACDDVALIAFTSGTTGEGKGTMHFH